MSRKLDAQLAQLIGLRDVEYDKVGGQWTGIKKGVNRHVVLPHYSTLECDSGTVLDHIAALGWMVTVYTGPYKNQGVKCRCCIMRSPQDFVLGGVDVVAETRPLAICRAFVEAMERWGDG